jgi:hypothetical protein
MPPNIVPYVPYLLVSDGGTARLPPPIWLPLCSAAWCVMCSPSNVGSFTITDLIHESQKTRIYHAVNAAGKYILKTVRSPTPADQASLRHEYAVLKDLQIDGVVRAIQLASFGGSLALVLADFENGLALRQVSNAQSSLLSPLVHSAHHSLTAPLTWSRSSMSGE